MQNIDLIGWFVRPLEGCDIPYMVTGSVAGMLYGEPRLTNDVDIVVLLRSEHIPVITSLFQEPIFYCPPADVLRVEAARSSRGHFNVIHLDSGGKADFYLACSPLHAWGLERKRRIDLDETSIWVAPPEYVILRKLEFYREGGSPKHLHDIRAMLAITGDAVDIPAIETWCTRLGLAAVWREARG